MQNSPNQEKYLHRTSKRALTGVIVSALTLSLMTACATPNKGAEQQNMQSEISVAAPRAIEAKMPAIPDTLSEFYTQKVAWEDCKKFQCSKIKVPLDYANPQQESVEIALKKRSADQEAIGTLLVNPGGPGASGLEMMDAANFYFPAAIRNHFDIIGFDPRGVGDSTPIQCVSDAELATLLEASYPDTPEGEAKSHEDTIKLANGCKQESGKLLPFVGTASAARDMDIIRHLSGDPRLYYLGYSYGTSLGGMYAELFPENVGRMVLDGAVSSEASNFEQSLAQMKGFEKSLDAYLKSCLENHDGNCPFTGNVEDARKQISYILKQTLTQPVPAAESERVLTQSALIYGIIATLYDDATWPALSKAFHFLINEQNPELFLLLFDSYTGRAGDKFKNNSMEANWAINCADYGFSGDQATWKKMSSQMAQESPIFGATAQYDEALCAAWAYQPKEKSNLSQRKAPHRSWLLARREIQRLLMLGHKNLRKLLIMGISSPGKVKGIPRMGIQRLA
ncbi:alpha/beta fold hydrolase [Arcanobacterium hippocoleae]